MKSIGVIMTSSSVVSILAPVLLIMLTVGAIMSAFKWLLDNQSVTAAAEVMQGLTDEFDITDYIEIKDRNIVFVKDSEGRELKDVLLQNISDSGIDPDAMGLTKDELIEDIIKAEIVTSYPYLGGDELQGIVNFYRRDYDANEEDEGKIMTYVEKDEFDKLAKKYEKSGDTDDWKKLKNVFYLEKQKGKSSGGSSSSGQRKTIDGVNMQVLRNGDGIVSVYNGDGSAMEGGSNDRFGQPLADGKVACKLGYIKDHSVIYIETSESGEGSHANGKFYYICDTGGGLVDGQIDVYVNGDQSTINAAPYGRTNSATISLVEEDVSWEDYLNKYHDATLGSGSSNTSNTNSSTAGTTNNSINNFLYIGDSILGTLKSGLESEGAKVIYQVSANANFFLGKVGSPSSEGICSSGQTFDWNSNIANLDTPSGICLVLGQNLCDDGATSYVDSGVNEIKELVEKLQNQFPNVPVYINSVVPCSSSYSSASNYKEGREKANELLKSYCSSTNNVTFIDSSEGYIDSSTGFANDGMTSDGLHPSSSGASILVNNLKAGGTGSSSSSGTNNNVSTINLVVATYKNVDGKITVERQKINYQTETMKYATPVEFLISHLQASNDVKYVKSMADMVIHNSRIDYVVQDQYTETKVEERESYKENTYKSEKDDSGNLKSVQVTNSTYHKMTKSSKTTKAISIVSYIKDADTWIVKVKQRYTKKVSGPTKTISNVKNLGSSDYNKSTGKMIVDRRTWTETTVYSITYVPATTTSTSSSTSTSGNSSAVLGNNETANKIMTLAESKLGSSYVYGATGPDTFDCSGLVLWVCQQAGANIPPRVTSDYPSSASQYEVNWNEMQPGDILQNNDHVGIYIGDGKYIHAPQTGDVVKIASLESRQAGSRKFTKVYRFW